MVSRYSIGVIADGRGDGPEVPGRKFVGSIVGKCSGVSEILCVSRFVAFGVEEALVVLHPQRR